MPVALVVGERDQKFRAIAERMAASIAHAQLIVVPARRPCRPSETPAECRSFTDTSRAARHRGRDRRAARSVLRSPAAGLHDPRIATASRGRTRSQAPQPQRRAAPPRSRAGRRASRPGRRGSRLARARRAASSRPVIPPQRAIFRQTASPHAIERSRASGADSSSAIGTSTRCATRGRTPRRPPTGSSHSSTPAGSSARSVAIASSTDQAAVGVEPDRDRRTRSRRGPPRARPTSSPIPTFTFTQQSRVAGRAAAAAAAARSGEAIVAFTDEGRWLGRAQQPPHRLAGTAPGEVPQREVDRCAARKPRADTLTAARLAHIRRRPPTRGDSARAPRRTSSATDRLAVAGPTPSAPVSATSTSPTESHGPGGRNKRRAQARLNQFDLEPHREQQQPGRQQHAEAELEHAGLRQGAGSATVRRLRFLTSRTIAAATGSVSHGSSSQAVRGPNAHVTGVST